MIAPELHALVDFLGTSAKNASLLIGSAAAVLTRVTDAASRTWIPKYALPTTFTDARAARGPLVRRRLPLTVCSVVMQSYSTFNVGELSFREEAARHGS
jgi:hypothetical protein